MSVSIPFGMLTRSDRDGPPSQRIVTCELSAIELPYAGAPHGSFCRIPVGSTLWTIGPAPWRGMVEIGCDFRYYAVFEVDLHQRTYIRVDDDAGN